MAKEPSAHLRELAGLDLMVADPPVVSAAVVREVAVVTSRSRRQEQEVFVERCERDGVPIISRPSGGGAVVLAPGVVAASVLCRLPRPTLLGGPSFDLFCSEVTAALVALGARDVSRRGVSDICLGDRKLAGSSLRLFGGKVLFQISILVDMDVELMDRYLRHPPRQPAYRHDRVHRDFVVTLRDAGVPVTAATVTSAMAGTLAAAAARGAA